MIELTAEQHQALATNGEEPVRAIDRATKAEYVLVRAEVYDRIKSLLSDDSDWHQGAYEYYVRFCQRGKQISLLGHADGIARMVIDLVAARFQCFASFGVTCCPGTGLLHLPHG